LEAGISFARREQAVQGLDQDRSPERDYVQNGQSQFFAAEFRQQKQKNPETASPRGAEDYKLFPGAMSSVFP
jgi:hypothetical protein